MVQKKITVVIADDHDIYRDSLKSLLNKDASILLLGEASNGQQLTSLVNALHPDVVLTDLIMRPVDDIQAAKEITAMNLHARILVFSSFNDEYLLVEAFEAGAKGYISKNAQKNEFVEAIKSVYDNYPYYCSSTSVKLIKLISKSSFNPYLKPAHDLFSEREKRSLT